MTGTRDLSASLERVVDAVLSHQMRSAVSAEGSLYDTVADVYADVASDVGRRIGSPLAAALRASPSLSALDVAGTASQMTVDAFVGELTSAAALVQLLAESLASRADTSASAVLAEVLQAAVGRGDH